MTSITQYLILYIATVISLVNCDIYRLPKLVKPIRYHLTMEPHLKDTEDKWETITYEGSVAIDLETLQDTEIIILHQVNLKINNNTIKIINSIGNDFNVKKTFIEEIEETYTIVLEKPLIKGENYKLTIGNFTGNLGEGEGFFKVFYRANQKPRGLAATHFEPTGARRAFPCFDEPSLKAKFVVSLIRKMDYTSVSNENLEKTEDLRDGRFKDTFKETPLMPTFTLAFAVTDFKVSEKLERHRIWARPEAIDNGEWMFSLDIANRTLIALEEFTGIKFVIDKLDQIAIPDEFFYENGMENWGLIVYGESHLLRGNNSQAEDYKRSCCYIAHEFAHQWFGNLVTPEWWDYLWLSEGFATYFQYYTADVVLPYLGLKEQFLIDVVHAGLEKEEADGAYSLNYPIEYSGQYPPFHIMYKKLHNKNDGTFFNTSPFSERNSNVSGKKVCFFFDNPTTRTLFICCSKFGNVVPLDLYKSIQEVVNQEGGNELLNNISIEEILGTWDTNKGFPIVTVTRNYETGWLTLEQKSSFEEDDKTSPTWIIPINFIFSFDPDGDFSKTTPDYWLSDQTRTIQTKFPASGWLIANKQQTGHYRVNYDLENWDRIIKFLINEDFTEIHVLNRAQLINDAFNLAYNKKLPWKIPLNIGRYIIRENDYIPLTSYFDAVRSYFIILPPTIDGENGKLQEFRYFGDYVLEHNIFVENKTEFDVYMDYLKMVVAGVNDRLGYEEKHDFRYDKIMRILSVNL